MDLTTHLSPPPLPLLLLRFARLEIGGLLRRTRLLLGGSAPRDLAVADLAVPDSALAQRATALARACEPAFLFNHSVRSYLFGIAIGLRLDLAPDRELLYVASVLHDLGLVPAHDTGRDFELDGARAAHAFALDSQVSEHRAALIHESIALHTSVGIADRRAPESSLLHFGAGLDVSGYCDEHVSASTRASVVEAWPREGLKEGLVRLLDGQVVHKPRCHIAGHLRLGFRGKIRRAPFDE